MHALNLNRAGAMQTALCQNVGITGQFGCIKHPKSYGFTVGVDGSPPLVAFGADSKISNLRARTPFTHVLGIFRNRYISKVGNPVITSDAVDVVNDSGWPRIERVKPCKPMSQIRMVVDEDVNVSKRLFTSSSFANATIWPRAANSSRENSGIRVVVQKLAQTLRSKIGLSHDALQLLIGQRPASVSALSGLRYFIPALSFAQRQTPNVSDGLRLAIYQWASPRLTGFFRPQWGTFSHS